VLLSIGVKPENKLAADAELALGQRGAIVVNEFQQTSNPDIYAAGDAVETADRVLEGRAVVPLGTPANRQGRLVADHIFMPEKARPYPGTQGTAIVRVFDTVAGVTGWTEKRLRSHGIEFDSAIVTDFNHAGYYPGATPVTLKILWRKNDGRLLGAQAAGADGIDKRLDVLSTAIAGALSAEDLADLELAYAPPFGSVRDVVNTAGFCARNIRDQLADFVAKPPKDSQFLDVRPPEITALDPVKGALTIPFGQLRKRLNEIDKAKPVVAVCALGKTSYFASRMLLQNGFDAMSLSGGLRVFAGSKVLPEHTRPISLAPSSSLIDSIPDATIDATGLACPGPLLKVREAIDRLPHGQCLEVRASDPGFAHDITAFCGAAGYPEPAIRKDKGIVIARIFKNPGERQFQPNRTQTTNLDTTLVVFSQEMDKALAALVIANGAAAMGGKVTLFFTFWGLNVLRRDAVRNAPQKGWMDRMFDFMLPRGPRKLPLSNMDFLGMGRAMMKWRMKSKGLPSVEGLLAQARRMGVRLVACSMSMDAMGIQLSELVDGVEVGGVADFMAASAQSGTNLFI
jgi:peroxiredoxin family protein/TusA-related sulfurtransferase/rhodanese-related sulfurtransferase